jgi:hypothetical protein
MRCIAIAIVALTSMSSCALAGEPTTSTPSLRQIVDEIEAKGFIDVHNGDFTIQLVRDHGQCALGEDLTPIWINFHDARQHLTGWTCQTHYD